MEDIACYSRERQLALGEGLAEGQVEIHITVFLALAQTLWTNVMSVELHLAVSSQGDSVDPSQLEADAISICTTHMLGLEVIVVQASVQRGGVPRGSLQHTAELQATLYLATSIHVAIQSHTRFVSLTYPVHHILAMAVEARHSDAMSTLERVAIASLDAVDEFRTDIRATYLTSVIVLVSDVRLCLPDARAIGAA